MERKWLAGVCLLLILTGCRAEAKAPQTYWTEEYEGYQVSLRDSGSPGALDVVLQADGQEEALLQTLTGAREEDVSADTFTDVMGWDGFRLTERQGLAVEDPAEDWSLRTYYAMENGVSQQIAESFGWGAPQDYSVDLDGMEEKELVSNVTYGGDGHQTVYVYQRRGDEVWRGRLSMENLPNRDDRGITSTSAVFDPARNMFQIRYTAKGQTGYALLETAGLERLEFTPYAPDTAATD